MLKTAYLTGAELCVNGIEGLHCDIRNDGAGTVYASKYPNVVPGADEVVSIPSGGVALCPDCRGTVYLLGSGTVSLCGVQSPYHIFTPRGSGGSGGGSAAGEPGEYATDEEFRSALGL